MFEYIDRESVLKYFKERYCLPCKGAGKDHNGCKCDVCWVEDLYGDTFRILERIPVADVAPVVNGRWKPNCVDRPAFFVCDQCNTVWYNDTKFCPNCGARMDGGAGNAAD